MCTMGSTPAMCETYCEVYGDYLYCISGAISWSQCLTGKSESTPSYGYPYFSPPAFIDGSDDADYGGKESKTGLIAGAVGGGIAGTAICFLLALLLYCYCRRLHPRPRLPKGTEDKSLKKDGSSSDDPTSNSKAVTIRDVDALASSGNTVVTVVHGHGTASLAPETIPSWKQARLVSLDEVRTATCTNNYSRKYLIGEGRFGSVYYGRLVSGEEVAVKVNSYKGHQAIQDFQNEVSILSGLHHPNVASLVGYCDEYQNRMLIYEFMPKKTLRHYLYGPGLKERLDWQMRLEIAVHAARGLEYLHHQCRPAIVHGDIKSSNVLLSDQFVAKIADVDVSKLSPEATSPKLDNREYFPPYDAASSRLPYYAPELLTSDLAAEGNGDRPQTTRSDVYAFGVVLLEIICGKLPGDGFHSSTIVTWARDIMKAGCVEKLADPTLAGTYELEVLWKITELAMACVEPLGIHRPDMMQVVLGLTDAIEIQNAADAAAADKISAVTSVESNHLSPLPADYPAPPLAEETGLPPCK